MNSHLLDVKEYTSAALWRRPEQLRGLLKNHGDVFSHSEQLFSGSSPEKTLCFSSHIALHSSENALAVSLSPITEPSVIGLISLNRSDVNLRSHETARWLSMPEGFQSSSLAWKDGNLLIGASRGRVLISALDAETDVVKGSSPLHVAHVLRTTTENEDTAPCIGELSSSPGAYASSAIVRSVSVSKVNPSAVTAACGGRAFRWDMHAGYVSHSMNELCHARGNASDSVGVPVPSSPICSWELGDEERNGSAHLNVPIMFTQWAPSSDTVVLTGNYAGALALVDTRENVDKTRRYLCCSSRSSAAVSADFNPLLPSVFSVASADGMVSVFDMRYTREALHCIPSLQGSLTSIKWLGLHSDLLCTGGVDGSVALWNLRCPPTFCVGRAQYGLPVCDLAATETFLKESIFGVTLGAEVTQTGLKTEAMLGLSQSLHSQYLYEEEKSDAQPARANTSRTTDLSESTALFEKECEACGLLYTRQIEKAVEVLADCAEMRFSKKETIRALHLVEMGDLYTPIPTDVIAFYEDLFRGESGPLDESADSVVSLAQRALNEDMIRSSRQLPSTLTASRIPEMTVGHPDDVQRLTSIRLNALLHQLLASRRLSDIFNGIPRALQLLSSNSALFDYMDVNTVCDTVSFVQQTDAAEGERFVRLLLELLQRFDDVNERKATRLVRAVLDTAQKPFITAGRPSKRSRRFEEKFYKDMDAAKEAVLTQLRMVSLGVDQFTEVIALADKYQGRCVENHSPGMFGWLSLKPLVVYLNCLAADSNYVTFLWTSVQYMETFAGFSGVRQIEQTLFAVVDRICASGTKMASRLEYYSTFSVFDTPQLKMIRKLLKTCHNYLSSILRVQLECENVAIESQMQLLPAVMEETLDVLMSATEELLNAWAGLLEALITCSQQQPQQKKQVCAICLPCIQEFSFRVEDLVEVSSKKENDDCLNEILETCDEFLDALDGTTVA